MIDVGTPFSRPFGALVKSLQTSLLQGVEQPGEVELLYRQGTAAYPVKGAGPVSGLAARITGFAAGKPAFFDQGTHYTLQFGQLVWQAPPAADTPGWYPDDNSRLTVGYLYRDLPSGITDFNAGSVAGTLVRAVSRELKLLYEQMDQAYRRAFVDYANGVALDNVVALLGIVRNPALPAQGEVTFSLKKAPRTDVVIPVGTRVADARGRQFKVTAPGLVPAALEETLTAAGTQLTASQDIASVVWARAKGSSSNLTLVPGPKAKPFGDDGRSVVLAAAPGVPVVLRYLAKAPTVTVPVVAMDTGPEGNLGSGSLTVMPTPPRGVDGGVTNLAPLTGGEAAEADEPLRERAKHALERAGNATLNAIRYAVLNVDGVDSVEVRDFSVDAQIPLGEVWVRFATGKPDLLDTVTAVVDQTRSAGIKARVSQVATVTITGTLCVIPDMAGASRDALAAYRKAVVDAIGALGIGEPLSLRKLAAKVFQVPGLADVAELQLDAKRGAAPAVPVAADPFLVAAGDQARPDDGAITVVPLLALDVSAATLKAGTTLTCTVKLLDDHAAAVPLRSVKLALSAAVRGRPAAAPNQPLAQVAQVAGSVQITAASQAKATFNAASIPSLAGLEAASLEVLVTAAAYPGLRAGSAHLTQVP